MKQWTRPGPGPTVQRQVLSVAAEVEVGQGRAGVLNHAPHMLTAEAAPGHVQLLDAAGRRRQRDGAVRRAAGGRWDAVDEAD